jgi:YfiR/HmsC-like
MDPLRFSRQSGGRGAKLRARVFQLCAALATMLCVTARVPAQEPLEYQVKAIFLLNFTKFIEWPAEAFATSESPIVICVLGDDPFGSALNTAVAGETVNGRKVAVERINEPPAPKSCQVLFVNRPEKKDASFLSEIGPGVLTVGEGDKFIHEGGTIAFVIEDRRVRFRISQGAVQKARLTVSSRLLSVARSVEK